MMRTTLLLAGICVLFFTACKKEGPGGAASISGKITGIRNGTPEAEITHVTCAQGMVIDDNDYFLLNTPNGNGYYVWYDNTNWAGGDPALSGRTGIKVIYDFSQSNSFIASNTAAAITTLAGSDFSVSVNNDIITLTCLQTGLVPDAQDINSPMQIDVANQGMGGTQGTPVPMADERVYLVYGDETFYGTDVRTDASGYYQFNGLTRGQYRVYALSYDQSNGQWTEAAATAEITSRKEVVTVPDITVYK